MSTMASSSGVFVPSPAAVSQKRLSISLRQNLSSISLRQNRVESETLRLTQRGQRRTRSTVAGAAKYKGTKMREEKLSEMIEEKVKEATEVCEADERSEECKVAWDEVEEVSQAKADLRLKLQSQDPLESFCLENPETDECRIYDD